MGASHETIAPSKPQNTVRSYQTANPNQLVAAGLLLQSSSIDQSPAVYSRNVRDHGSSFPAHIESNFTEMSHQRAVRQGGTEHFSSYDSFDESMPEGFTQSGYQLRNHSQRLDVNANQFSPRPEIPSERSHAPPHQQQYYSNIVSEPNVREDNDRNNYFYNNSGEVAYRRHSPTQSSHTMKNGNTYDDVDNMRDVFTNMTTNDVFSGQSVRPDRPIAYNHGRGIVQMNDHAQNLAPVRLKPLVSQQPQSFPSKSGYVEPGYPRSFQVLEDASVDNHNDIAYRQQNRPFQSAGIASVSGGSYLPSISVPANQSFRRIPQRNQV